jgi:hypothetical protein
MLGLTLWVTAQPQITNPAAARTLSGLLFYYSLTARFPRRPLPVPGRVSLRAIFLLALPLFSFFLAVAALLTVDWSENKLPFLPLAFLQTLPRLPEVVHPNVISGSLLLLVPLPLAHLLFRRPARAGRLLPVLYLLLSLFLLFVILVTKSRGAYLGLAAALAVLAGLRWRWRGWLAALLAAALAAAVLFLLSFHPRRPRRRIQQRRRVL